MHQEDADESPTITQAQFEPARFEERGPLTIAGLGGTFTAETRDGIPALWKRFAPHIGKVPGQVGNAAYGVSSMERGGIDYIAGVEVSDGAKLPHGFSEVRLTAKTYAVFEHRGHVSTIPETVGEIGRDWLPHSGWEPAEGFRRSSSATGATSIRRPPAASSKS